jgi:hypothetical protein
MDAKPEHLALVVATMRRLESESTERDGPYAPYLRIVRLESGCIHVDHPCGMPLVRLRRLGANLFRLEQRAMVGRGTIGWERVPGSRDGRLETIFRRWDDPHAYHRSFDLWLCPVGPHEPRPEPPPLRLVPPPVRAEVLGGLDWLASPTPGPIAVEPLSPSLDVAWEGSGKLRAAQRAAARVLVEQAGVPADVLADALYVSFVEHSDHPDFGALAGPQEVREHTWVRRATLLETQRGGLAYVHFDFGSDAWEEEHGLGVIVHGTRAVSVGGSSDQDPGDDDGRALWTRQRAADGALLAASWLEHPHDAVVAFSAWEGRPGRFAVRFQREDGETGCTDPQIEAARRLVHDGKAVREAAIEALVMAAATSPRASRAGFGTRERIEPSLAASEIVVSVEDLDGVAYSELRFVVPWSKDRARVVMHGARAVAVPRKGGAAAAVEADQEAAVAARRARNKQARGRAIPLRPRGLEAR